MKHLNDIDVLVLGLGESGLAMARWCARHGARVRVWDSRENAPQDAALAERLPQAQHLKEYWEAEQAGTDLDGSIQEVEKAEADLKSKKARLVSAIAEGILELGDAKSSLDTIKAQLDDLNRKKIKIIDSAENPPDWKLMSFERYEFENTSFELKRELLTAIFEEIRVFESYAILVYRFPRNDKGDHLTRIHLPKPKRRAI
jgi:hypothetical protein